VARGGVVAHRILGFLGSAVGSVTLKELPLK